MRLSDFTTLTFDVYGTLIDWESGIMAGLEPLLARLSARPSRDDVLQAHAFHESTLQRQTPAKRYSDLLAVVYKRLAEEWRIPAPHAECQAYGRSVRDWPAFTDSAAALADLKRHFRLVVLSNVDNESFAASAEKLGVTFDAAYTAEDIGSYKPSPRNFDYMLTELARLGVARHEILHTAESMFHDHAPATRAGLARCHIFRRHAQPGFGATMTPENAPAVDWVFHSMADFAEARRRECQP